MEDSSGEYSDFSDNIKRWRMYIENKINIKGWQEKDVNEIRG